MRTCRWAMPVIVPALLTTGCDTPEDDTTPAADHKVASGPPAARARVDPADGPLIRTWQTELRGESGTSVNAPRLTPETRFAVTSGQILTIHPGGVDTIATQDGKTRWHYHDPRRGVVTYALTAGTLILVIQRPPDDVRTVALDAATGRELWRSTAFRPVGIGDTAWPRGDGVVQASGRGMVALADAKNRSTLFGVHARTGARRWTWPDRPRPAAEGGRSCAVFPYESDGSLLLVQRSCAADEGPLTALDPRTGRRAWQRPFTGAVSARPSAKAGLTLLPESYDGHAAIRLIGGDGRELYEAESPTAEPASLVVAGDRAILTHRHGLDPGKPGSDRRVGFDLATGKAGEPVPADPTLEVGVGARDPYARLDRLTSFDGAAAWLLPGGLETIDPRTLKTERIPLPTTATSDFWTGGMDGTRRVSLIDGRVYVATDGDRGLRLSEYAPGGPGTPAALGGVPARDWPDACELGTGLAGLRATGAQALDLGPAKIPAWACTFEPEDGDGSASVWTAWVARNAAEADRMLDPADSSLMTDELRRPIPGLGDEAYRLPKLMDGTVIALRAGRYIALVKSSGSGDPRRLAEHVADKLRRRG